MRYSLSLSPTYVFYLEICYVSAPRFPRSPQATLFWINFTCVSRSNVKHTVKLDSIPGVPRVSQSGDDARAAEPSRGINIEELRPAAPIIEAA